MTAFLYVLGQLFYFLKLTKIISADYISLIFFVGIFQMINLGSSDLEPIEAVSILDIPPCMKYSAIFT